MATQEDVRRIALSLPQTSEAADHFGFGVFSKGKLRGFAWAWNERIEPKKARVPNPEVLAVRVASLPEKEELLAADPEKFFTEPHYNGFPAVLVRLPGDRCRRTRGADYRRLALPGTPRSGRRTRPPSAVGPGDQERAVNTWPPPLTGNIGATELVVKFKAATGK